jgi:hypothetical protein
MSIATRLADAQAALTAAQSTLAADQEAVTTAQAQVDLWTQVQAEEPPPVAPVLEPATFTDTSGSTIQTYGEPAPDVATQ